MKKAFCVIIVASFFSFSSCSSNNDNHTVYLQESTGYTEVIENTLNNNTNVDFNYETNVVSEVKATYLLEKKLKNLVEIFWLELIMVPILKIYLQQ